MKTKTGKKPKSRRWLRLVIPFAVVLAVLIFTGVVHAMQEPDVTDPAFLSPGATAEIGGSRPAPPLPAPGGTLDPGPQSPPAPGAAEFRQGAPFLPPPRPMPPLFPPVLQPLPAHTPGGAPAAGGARRAAPPGCALREARAAGPAGVYHVHYDEVDAETAHCYDGALVGTRYAAAEVMLVGANEPFRNDRIGEYGNAALATGLLAAHPRVVWPDLPPTEAAPGLIAQSPHPGHVGPPPPPGTRRSPDPDLPLGE